MFQEIIAVIDKSDFMKLKNYIAKDIITRVKRDSVHYERKLFSSIDLAGTNTHNI
jgi:hypothetical protein